MFELVRIATEADAQEEGRVLKHAVGMIYARLIGTGVSVYSLREKGRPVLTISVRRDAEGEYCDHVVGYRNRAPSEAELMTLQTLLLHSGIQLRYDPMTTS